MKRFVSLAAVAAIVLTALSACKTSEDQTDTSPGEPAYVTVHNRNVLDVTVYALRSTERIRLGTITSGNSERFVLSEYLVVNAPLIRFVADPIGSTRSILIGELVVFPGDEIDLYVPARRL